MFKRRNRRDFFGRMREYIWPSMGLSRAMTYLRHRLVRLKDSPHSIAAGLAVGVAISFSPVIGTHFIQCAIICFVLRFNILASFLGTVIGNPTTFPFIWAASYALGRFVLGLFGVDVAEHVPGEAVSVTTLWESFDTFSHIFWPWMLGGYILAFVSWFPAYFIFKSLINTARVAQEKAREALREKLKERQAHKIAKEVTGQKK